MSKPNFILVVDDNPEIQDLIRYFLVVEGFRVLSAINAAEALAILAVEEPDLILLDIQMPDMDGVTFCRHIRSQYEKPIIFLTGNKNQEDKVKSLQSGGDDYMTKPFDSAELIARVKANLRWSKLLEVPEAPQDFLRFPGLEIDLRQLTAKVNQEPVQLFAKDLQMLIVMARQPNQVFHPEQLYNQVWKDNTDYSLITVKSHIYQLRKKIEPNPARPSYIITLKGFGYKFNPYGASGAK